MEVAMRALIDTVVRVKDPITLFAFIAVIALIAFRTKTVPQATFKLVNTKMTREHFSRLLNRALTYTFVIFLVLCAVAVCGQVLDYLTTARAASLDDLKAELAKGKADERAAQQALDAYKEGVAKEKADDVRGAIASLEQSIKAVPTAAARQTLLLLYRRAGETERESKLAAQIVADAREKGGILRALKVDRLVKPSESGGSSVEDASIDSQVGIGTLAVVNLKGRIAEVYSQESAANGTWEVGYAGTISDKAPTLQVPTGIYKLKFANAFAGQVHIMSGRTTTVTLGAIDIKNLMRDVEVYAQDSAANGTWEIGYAGTLSPKSPTLQVPPGTYKLKFANHFAEHIRVGAGQATSLK